MSERNEDMDIVQDPAASDNLCNQSRPDAVKLSVVSKNYDMGSKGYLDDEEQVLRNLDKGNQGHLSVESLKVLVRDLDKSNQEKRMLKTVVKVFSVGLVVFLLANFGLVWSTLLLTQKINSQDGALVDSKTRQMLATKAHGTHARMAVTRGFFKDRMDSTRHLEQGLMHFGSMSTGEFDQISKAYQAASTVRVSYVDPNKIQYWETIEDANFSTKIFQGNEEGWPSSVNGSHVCNFLQFRNRETHKVLGEGEFTVQCCITIDDNECQIYFENSTLN